MMYESSPGVWSNVLSDGGGSYITILHGQTSVDVKIKTINDGALVDDGESLILTGTISSGTTNMANTIASATTIITELPSITVSAPTYALEGNSAIFEVGLTNFKTTSTAVTLGISGDVNSGDYSTTSYQYSTDGGNSWTTVSGNVNGATLTIPAGTTTNIPSILVKVSTVGSDGADNLESMVLTATAPINSGISSYGLSASDNTVIVEPLALSVTEKKDGVATANTSVTTTLDTNYTYVKINDGANGTVVQNSNGTLTYTANTDFSGADSFSYQMINKTTGEIVTSVANVAVTAVADTPIITIGANLVVAENVFQDNAWKAGSNNGNTNTTILYQNLSSASIGTSGNLTTANGEYKYMIQKFDTSTVGSQLQLDFSATGSTGSVLNFYWATVAADGTITKGSSYVVATTTSGNVTLNDVASVSGTVTVPNGYNAIILFNEAKGEALTINSLSLAQSVGAGNTAYDVHIFDAITDSDNVASGTTNKEELQSVTLQVKDSSNTVISSSGYFNQGTYDSSTKTWTFTQVQLDGLKVTVATSLVSSGFKLEAVATSKELSNGSIASNSATVTISNADDTPTIGDQTLNVTNGNANTNGSNIATDYSSNGTNVFSWDPSKSSIPDLYANGQKVVITYDNVAHKVTGTIDNGATTIFTTTITMADNNGTTLNYTQGNSLLGVANMLDGDIVLPGGGNNAYRVFQFTDSNSSATVDALVSAHNLIEDTAAQLSDSVAEHTVNTNNYYIGVDSNNMNAGQQLVFDFKTVATYDGITTHANEVSEINIKLFNFDSAKSGDELYITVITKDPANANGTIRENILLTQNSDYSTELEYTVKSATGNPIVGVEFLAGNESSFKLGIASIGSISYNDTFQMKFGYDITDTDTTTPSVVGVVPSDSDSGLTTITVGSGTVNTSLDYNLDSKIVFDSTDRIIDGGAGIDTLVLGSNIDIDFSSYANSIKNIEKIDMTNSLTTNDLANIKLQDILNITDSNHLLTILGDGNGTAGSSDSVILKNTSSTVDVWSLSSSDATYNTYVNSGDNTVTLKIDHDISVSIIN